MTAEHSFPSETDTIPYYHPIVSLQSQRIIGYESLGRQLIAGKPQSLGPFFHNPDIGEAAHVRLDRHLRKQAIEKWAGRQGGELLFLNLKPSWIYRLWKEQGFLYTLSLLDRHRVDPGSVVIEITEEEFGGNLYELAEIVEQYRLRGCTIAIDDVGSGFSNFDRIAVIRPKILKLDLELLKKSHSHQGYRAVMRSFSILASQLGASLLVEGVETDKDLLLALQAGARYVQGYLFSVPVPDFLPEDRFAPLIDDVLERYRRQEIEKYGNLSEIDGRLSELLTRSLEASCPDEADGLVQSIVEGLPGYCHRAYICTGDGKQLSANFSRTDGGSWARDASYRGCNWIWRPYFISNITLMNAQDKGILSTEYTDLETSAMIQTYSYPIGSECYLFIDLSF
jgi:EAL domain-containing protein (putative c-di-GMP-specific phosphodiesterase class I)